MASRILLQFDSDDHASSFDSIVAVDAGVDQLLTYDRVSAENVTGLVHGAMFTRGGEGLKNTGLFVGGSNVTEAEKIFQAAQSAFFGPVRVSLMLDASGCNTTASAAVVAAARHQELRGAKAIVLGGTGPVGSRVALLLAKEGSEVIVTSRSHDRAAETCRSISDRVPGAKLSPISSKSAEDFRSSLDGVAIVVSAGAAGVELIDEQTVKSVETLAVAIDLNAVPPAGIGGLGATDKAVEFGHGVGYGAIGVGGLKMRTHKAAIQALFEANDRVLDAEAIYEIAKSLG